MTQQQKNVQDLMETFAPARRELNRRSFLKAGLMAGAGLSTGLTLGGCSASSVTKPDHIQALSPDQYHLFERLVQVLLPTEGTNLVSPQDVPILRNIDAMFGGFDASMQEDLGSALQLFKYGSYLSGFHFRAFPELDDEAAVEYIESWQNGLFLQRAIAATLKRFVYASYWREPATWEPIEFDGPVSEQWGLPSLGNAPLPMA